MSAAGARLAAVALATALAAGPSRARTPDWADEPASQAPAYATSRAICAGLKGMQPSAADRPGPADEASLADCSSEASLFGLGVPADPKAARLCAFHEKQVADPQVTDFGFTGDRTLMTVYADGLGVSRNLDLAAALACRAGGTPAEVDARVRRLARLKAEGWTGADFSPCDDASSGPMRATCADHDQLVARAGRARAFAALSAGWSAGDRAAFAPLRRAAAAYADARGQDESDAPGTDRGPGSVAAEEGAERGFAALLVDAEAGRVAPATPEEARGAQAALDAAFRALADRARSPAAAARLASADRAWRRYRDAWAAFAGVRYPTLPPDALLARLAGDRAALLAAIPARG